MATRGLNYHMVTATGPIKEIMPACVFSIVHYLILPHKAIISVVNMYFVGLHTTCISHYICIGVANALFHVMKALGIILSL